MSTVRTLIMLLLLATPAPAAIIRVDADATGDGDGSSWAHAFVDLQQALAVAEAESEIWVAEGTYQPTTVADWNATFQLVERVRMYGGFRGDETSRAQRDWKLHETILSGDIGPLPPDSPPGVYLSIKVVAAYDADSTTVLDGFTIRDGHLGMHIRGGKPRILNTLFTGNRGNGDVWLGGGVYLEESSRPLFRDVQFIDNRCGTGFRGGGLSDLWMTSRPRLEQVLFEDNYGFVCGGGMWGCGDLVDVEFRGNRCDDFGGGLYGGGTLTRVRFVDNYTNQGGGGMAVGNAGTGNTEITDAEFIGNSCGGYYGGGGILGARGLRITNALFERNYAAQNGGAISAPGGGLHLANVEILNNTAGTYGRGGGISIGSWPWDGKGDPPSTLLNVTLAGNWAGKGLVGTVGLALYSSGGDVSFTNVLAWHHIRLPGYPMVVFVEGATATYRHCLIQGTGGSGAGWNSLYGADLGGNLDADPVLSDWKSGDLRLTAISPAIDAGDSGALPPGLTVDRDGKPRLVGAQVDIGAHEFQGVVVDPALPEGRLPALRVTISPNPFNPSTRIEYTLASAGPVEVVVHDLAGRRVRTLDSGLREAGSHAVIWEGRDERGHRVASGVYVCRVQAGGQIEHRRLVLVK